jgi:hypothetical protein
MDNEIKERMERIRDNWTDHEEWRRRHATPGKTHDLIYFDARWSVPVVSHYSDSGGGRRVLRTTKGL